MEQQQGRSETSRTSVPEKRAVLTPHTPDAVGETPKASHGTQGGKDASRKGECLWRAKGGPTGKQRQRIKKLIIFVVILGDHLAWSELTSFTNVMVLTANYEPHCEPLYCSREH